MKKIIFSILSFIVLGLSIGNANFTSNNFTEINGSTTFNKVHGDGKILFLYEDFRINPFVNSNIVKDTCSGNACTFTYRYFVDSRLFNSSHSKYKNIGYEQNWVLENGGIQTKIEYLEKTFKYEGTVIVPNQDILVRKYYKIPFSYDITLPTCGDVKLFNDNNLTHPFSYAGGWLNTTKFYTMECSDPETGCKCDVNSSSCEKVGNIIRTPALVLGYKARPEATFTNNVNLTHNSCTGNLPSGISTILYDQKTPKIDMFLSGSIDFRGNLESHRDYIENTNGKLFFKNKRVLSILAGTKNIKFNITDEYLNSSTHGVSGIKKVEIKSYRIKDINHNNISEVEIINSGCNLTQNFSEYNQNGNIEETDIRGRNINLNCDDFQKSGLYKIVVDVFDWAGNETRNTSYFNVYPNNNIIGTINGNSNGDKYANNLDNYTYTLKLEDNYGNPIYNKELKYFNQENNGVTGFETIKVNDGSDGIIEDIVGITNDEGKIDIKIKSLSPGKFSEYFKIKVLKWDEKFINNSLYNIINIGNINNSNIFKKPVLGKIELDSLSGIIPEIGKDQKYKIRLINTGSLINYSDGNLNISESTVKSIVSGHYWNTFDIINKNFNNNLNTNLYFSGSIDGSMNLLKSPKIETNDIEISYKLGGKNIRYYLDDFEIAGASCDFETLGVKIHGSLQGDGKGNITGQAENVSDLSKGSLRSKIRMNAYRAIKNMSHNQIFNKIKYVEGDITISGNITNYETLVVKNGNVIISGNLNPSKNKLGIIVLKDNYITKTDYDKKGNVYVNNNVSTINAIIYADGTLRSATNGGNSYEDSEITNILTLYGSLFTRNTIGGAVKGSTTYTLPGGEEIDNFTIAEKYDLNYVRKVAKSCDGDDTNDYSFIIKYNPSIQTDPPKLFSK